MVAIVMPILEALLIISRDLDRVYLSLASWVEG